MKTYLNTPAIYAQSASKVDRENGIISNVVVAAIGEAKGHNIHLDDNFLNEVVSLASNHKTGIKARFGHPNICTTALGTYLGRFKNFRHSPIPPNGGTKGGDSLPPSGGTKGGGVLADLHLDNSAKKSPNGDLYEYVLDMAENNPDMFGASIAFKQGEAIKKFSEVDGIKIEKSYATIKALYATDLVDSPAATDGLFETFHQDEFAFQVTTFLDNNPDIFKLLDNNPEILNDFLTKYKQYKAMNFSTEITKLKDWITDNFAKLPEELSEEHQSVFDTLKSEFETKLNTLSNSETEITSLNEQVISLTDSNRLVTEENTNLQSQIDTLTSELNQLKATSTAIPSPADPNVSLSKSKKINNGILDHMPTQLRKQIKKQNK